MAQSLKLYSYMFQTVVSGTVDPDTIIVSTEDPNNLKVESVVQGRKDRQLAITGNILFVMVYLWFVKD